jgi:hypothetical protein
MRQVLYCMQFKGSARPARDESNVLEVTSPAPSCAVTSVVGPAGIESKVEPASGQKAEFRSRVTLISDGRFKESGSIMFGEGGHLLRFETIGEGFFGQSADPGLQQGSVMWRIIGGEGAFEGASGLITSNFLLGADGSATDHQFGLLFVR